MKTFTYQGQNFVVPDWATYIAADPAINDKQLPAVYAYQWEPILCADGFWMSSSGPWENVGRLHVLVNFPVERIK